MLLALRDYLAKEKCVSLTQMSRDLNVAATALQPMLDVWVHRGVCRKETPKLACKDTCFGCNEGEKVYYCYLN